MPGVLPFTPAFASPEQKGGGAITTASDIYSLGLVLARLTPEATRPRDLDAVVRTAAHEDPARRYVSAEQLADDLRRWSDGYPVRARHDSFAYRVDRFVRRNPGGDARGVRDGVAGGGPGGGAAPGPHRDTEAAKAERVTEFVTGMLRSADPRGEGRDVTVAEALRHATTQADSALGDRARGPGRGADGDRAHLGRDSGVTTTRSPSSARPSRPIGAWDAPDGRTFRATCRAWAASMRTAGNFPPRIRSFARRWMRSRRDARRNSGKRPASSTTSAMRCSTRATSPGPRRRIARRWRSGSGSSASESVEVAESLNNLAVILLNRGDWAGAEALLREVLATVRKVRGPEHPDVSARDEPACHRARRAAQVRRGRFVLSRDHRAQAEAAGRTPPRRGGDAEQLRGESVRAR